VEWADSSGDGYHLQVEPPTDVKTQAEKARRVVDSRLLTQDEFKQMEARQLSKQISADKCVSRTAKRSRPDDDAQHQEFVTCLLCSICLLICNRLQLIFLLK